MLQEIAMATVKEKSRKQNHRTSMLFYKACKNRVNDPVNRQKSIQENISKRKLTI